MQFLYQLNARLPDLAWAAVLCRGSPTISVHHGRRVEVSDRFFVEGVWDGDFAAGGFDRAETFSGTGGRLCDAGVVFSSPSHNLDRVFSIRKNDALHVSNTPVFLMVLAGEELDPRHPDYFFDYLKHYRTGLRQLNKFIRTRSGIEVRFHDCQNLYVDTSLDYRSTLREFGAPHKSFEAYESLLSDTLGRSLRNARDRSRRHPLTPVSAVSRGYDSTAVAALASDHRCDQALTYRKSRSDGAYCDDSGKSIAERLGFTCAEFDRVEPCDSDPDLLKTNFQNVFGGSSSSFDQLKDHLKDKMLLSGRHGEHFWGTDPSRCLPWYQEVTARGASGQGGGEFRLRIGFNHFHLPYTGGVHAPSLLKISRSRQMAPWRIGGAYDRPIPRRILESRGVPRDWFGMRKLGGGNPDPGVRVLPPAAEAEFREFYRDYVPETVKARMIEGQRGDLPFTEKGRARGLDRWLRAQYGLRTLSEWVLAHRNHQRRDNVYLYTFHWGFLYMMDKYRRALRHC